MKWIKEDSSFWRIAFLGLLVVGLSGPWGYDVIHLPAGFSCSEPWVRLKGDFCGLAVSPISFFGDQIVQPLIILLSGPGPGAGETVRDVLQFLLFLTLHLLTMILLLPLMIPLLSTVILIFRGYNRNWRRFNKFALVLAGALGVFTVFGSFLSLWRSGLAIWGVWLYTGLVAVMLYFEVSRSGRQDGDRSSR
jgi:hypothetical protein